jgi:hypothetical protein
MAQTDQRVEKIIDVIVVAGHKGQIGEAPLNTGH